MAKKITWWEAAELIGARDRAYDRCASGVTSSDMTDCSTSRGVSAAFDPCPMEVAEEVLQLYRGVYFDLNMRHFHEKLQENQVSS